MLDLRLPIGMMFSLVGGLLVIYGLVTRGAAVYERSRGISWCGLNVNFWWGLTLAVFGLAMFYFSRRDAKRNKPD
jgi:hypothetical protein